MAEISSAVPVGQKGSEFRFAGLPLARGGDSARR